MSINPAAAVAHTEHDGLSDYFCSTTCHDTFAAEPATNAPGPQDSPTTEPTTERFRNPTMTPITTHTSLDITECEAAVRDALAQQGFGILTEIDVAATFKDKLGIDRAPLKILGACNATLAHRALEVDPAAALVLPCNVVLEATEHGTTVTAADPRDILTNPALTTLADEAAAKLRAAIDNLAASS